MEDENNRLAVLVRIRKRADRLIYIGIGVILLLVAIVIKL